MKRNQISNHFILIGSGLLKWSEFEIARLVVPRLQFMKLDCALGQSIADVCVLYH